MDPVYQVHQRGSGMPWGADESVCTRHPAAIHHPDDDLQTTTAYRPYRALIDSPGSPG